MPFRIRIRLSFLVPLALLAATGCGEEEDVSPSFEDRIPLALELEAADRVVDWKDSTTLSGVLTQGDEKLAGEEVVLEGDSYPFSGDFAEIESQDTDAQGRFEFEAAPDANTAYRVAAGEQSEATSREVRVYVDPLTELVKEPAGNGTRFTTLFRHPKDRSIQGSTVFSYAATVADAEATGKLRFIKFDRVEQERQGLSAASITLPFAATDVEYKACYGYAPDSGMGVPDARCSQSRIAAG
ncbi:MAG: hypothetical protein QOI31_2269 [Solirubrobacterales bacterium]|jgi:hypothetical protein|nr:hypothetical protein [Solirubrobacterales bacterium]